MTTEKERNNKHIRILLQIIGMVVIVVAGFMVVRERTKVNAADIKKNGEAIKALVQMRMEDREDVMEMKITIGKIDAKQQAIKEGIARIEEKL